MLRRQRVLFDADLAELYGVPTKALNQAVRRNQRRFPPGFLLRISTREWAALRSQFVTLENGRGRHRKYLPLAFTEHGAIMAATVLNSDRAVDMSVYVVRAFIKLRQVLASNADLARKLATLEESVAALDASTRQQFQEVYRAIRALMALPAPKTRPIGFTANIGDDR
ncbi:MAG: ORF6N domain-containing protein [Burkholderiales bacterium]